MIRLVMERAGLTLWPMLSLLIFITSSLGMIIWLYRPGSRAFYNALSQLALDDAQGQGKDQGQAQILKGKG